MRTGTGHQFWPDSISILDEAALDASRIHGPLQVTDTYLLALARANGGVLATLDTKLATAAVSNGSKHLLVIRSPS